MTDDERELMTNITPFGLRMQPDLKARIAEAAKQNSRSMNAEIVARLSRSFWIEERLETKQMLHESSAMMVDEYAKLYEGLRDEIVALKEAVERLSAKS